MIEARAAEMADATAIVHDGPPHGKNQETPASFPPRQISSFSAMNQRANQLARRLRSMGAGPDVLVAICADRSVEMVVGLLAILKSGAAYLPLDPTYPTQRLAFMIQDSGAGILLAGEGTADLAGAPGVSRLTLDANPQLPFAPEEGNLDSVVGPFNLAYAIYTSGSTGRPKGAMNSHQALTNRLMWMHETYGLTDRDRVLQKTPMSFDVSVWEFFWPLMAGARLVTAWAGRHGEPAYLVWRHRPPTDQHLAFCALHVAGLSGGRARQ